MMYLWFLTFWPQQVPWSHIYISLIKSSEEVTTTCIVNKDDKLFSGPFYVSTISDKRSSCGSSCIKRDSPSIMLRQVNDSEIDLRKHDQPKNTDNESTKFVNIISGSVIGIKRWIYQFFQLYIIGGRKINKRNIIN